MAANLSGSGTPGDRASIGNSVDQLEDLDQSVDWHFHIFIHLACSSSLDHISLYGGGLNTEIG